jgi:multicomponent Na+:H+ antiporter subunit B
MTDHTVDGHIIEVILLVFMTVSAFWVVRLRNLFAVVMLSGIYSLFAAALYVVMDAVDVAFTEAAVGAGVSTVLMLGTLALTSKMEKVHQKPKLGPILLVLTTGGLLIYGTLDMPRYGDINAPINQHVANLYIEKSGAQTGVPNIVTSVLASYRGYDTFGETVVVFTAAAGVLAIIGRAKGGAMPTSTVARRRKEDEDEDGNEAENEAKNESENGGTPS